MSDVVLDETTRNNLLISDADFRALHFEAMQTCSLRIQEIVTGNFTTLTQEEVNNFSSDERQENIDTNLAYLTDMVAQDVWTTEDMTAINDAITSGKEY